MVHINDIEQFEAHLEQGLGEALKGRPFSLRSDLRLRLTGVCAVTSVAIHESLRRQNIHSEIVISKPRFTFDPSFDHVFVVTDDGTVIDGSYSQFIEHGGVLPYDVERGDVDEGIYPERKIEQFKLGDSDRVVNALTTSVMKALALEVYFDHYDRRHFTNPGFYGSSTEEITASLREVWLPQNFVPFDATRRTIKDGIKMASNALDVRESVVA